MALHLDVEIVERHRHGLDLFPDDSRVVPFGMGATVFYNYLDFRFRNLLGQPLMLRVSVAPPLLSGAFYSDRDNWFDVEIVETDHRFFRDGEGVVWRENRVARRVSYRNGRKPAIREIAHNVARVRYRVPEELIESAAGPGT
jgi:vancomycin resistance protein VanW